MQKMHRPTKEHNSERNLTKMREHRHTFRNDRGENLIGILVDAGSQDTVLVCHGFMANKDMCQFPLIASTLANRGLSSFRFDHPCAWNGESERIGHFLLGNHEEEVDDMKCAVHFLRSQGRSVICLMGHSKGGTNALMYAATIGDVPAVINLAGRYRAREGFFQRVSLSVSHTPFGMATQFTILQRRFPTAFKRTRLVPHPDIIHLLTARVCGRLVRESSQ
jgi:alpha-beta hydrolase superfamily lysophospholipase